MYKSDEGSINIFSDVDVRENSKKGANEPDANERILLYEENSPVDKILL